MQTLIKKLLKPGNYATNMSMALLLLRLAAGFFMLTHGAGKFSKLISGEPISFADPIGIGETASLALAVFAEVLCSILLILGLATRFAAIPLLITMLVAAFITHAGDGFGKKELPLLYAAIHLALALSGAGKYSLDSLITNKNNR